MSRGERYVLGIGLGLCAVGFLLVSFVAYQLWGTALYEDAAQARLHKELSSELHRSLPGSLSPHRTSGGSRLPPLASTPAPQQVDPPLTSPVGLLSIPAIGVSFTIVEGVGAAQLEQGPGHYPGTPLPGEFGNAAIAGHRTTYAHPFYNLTGLRGGDPIYVLTAQGFFKYTVVQTQVVSPSDTGVLASTSSLSTLTLTTCNPRYSAATRMVVTADFTSGAVSAMSPPTTDPHGAVGRGTNAGTPTRAAPGGSESYWPGALWGLGTLAAALVLWRIWRRLPRRLRWLPVVVGVPVVAVGLLMCFEHISLALPASF